MHYRGNPSKFTHTFAALFESSPKMGENFMTPLQAHEGWVLKPHIFHLRQTPAPTLMNSPPKNRFQAPEYPSKTQGSLKFKWQDCFADHFCWQNLSRNPPHRKSHGNPQGGTLKSNPTSLDASSTDRISVFTFSSKTFPGSVGGWKTTPPHLKNICVFVTLDHGIHPT